MVEFTEEQKKAFKKYNDWYMTCPCGRNAFPFVNGYFVFKAMPVKHPENYTQKELEEIIDKAREEHKQKHPQYVNRSDYITFALRTAMIARNPTLYFLSSWEYDQKIIGHTSKWMDEKYLRMAEAICVHGFETYAEVEEYVYGN